MYNLKVLFLPARHLAVKEHISSLSVRVQAGDGGFSGPFGILSGFFFVSQLGYVTIRLLEMDHEISIYTGMHVDDSRMRHHFETEKELGKGRYRHGGPGECITLDG